MHVKKGDKVKILTGKDRGKSGKIIRAMPKRGQVVVEGLNLVKKHQRARKSNEKGQILERPMPIHASNIKKVE
jgi:large subunit ribosomal protein L24